MASLSYGLDKTYIADSALLQYSVVLYNTALSGHCTVPAAASDALIAGVVQEAATASGDIVRVRKEGITKVLAEGAIAIGNEVGIADIRGMVDDTLAAWASGDGVLGVAEETATASGDIIACWLQIRTVL